MLEMDKIKRESEAAILKYIIKRYNLPLQDILEEADSEDVRFNFEFTLSNMKNPDGRLAQNPLSAYEDGKAENVSSENEMAVAYTLKIMSYDELIITRRRFQDRSFVMPYQYATLLRGRLSPALQTALDFFIFVRALCKPDDNTMFALFVAKHKGMTYFTKMAIEKVQCSERTFLGPLWTVAINWLKGNNVEQDKKKITLGIGKH